MHGYWTTVNRNMLSTFQSQITIIHPITITLHSPNCFVLSQSSSMTTIRHPQFGVTCDSQGCRLRIANPIQFVPPLTLQKKCIKSLLTSIQIKTRHWHRCLIKCEVSNITFLWHCYLEAGLTWLFTILRITIVLSLQTASTEMMSTVESNNFPG